MMTNKTLLCLLIVCLTTDSVFCRFGSRSSGRSSGSHSRGGGSSHSWGGGSSHSWGGGSSHSSYNPSSSSSFGSNWKPSSSSGHQYPSSSSGLSGIGSIKPSYPSSSTGLSGSGSKYSYPSSSTGLSGSGSKYNYPSSSTGLSGSGPKHSYPSSSSGFSGTGTGRDFGTFKLPSVPTSGTQGSRKLLNPTSGSGFHSYPPSPGISGNEKPKSPSYPAVDTHPTSFGNNYNKPSYDNSYRPSNTYLSNSGYGSGYKNHGYSGNTHSTYILPPNYHTYPQYVYVREYRDSGSRYGDILTGLALYNMGRSHSHYHDHYYYDDYYRRQYTPHSGSSNSYGQRAPPKDEATCTLRVNENGRLEVLKIPCEIVSTFVEDGKRSNYTQTQTNITTCVTNVISTNTTGNRTAQENSTETTLPVVINYQNLTTPLPISSPTPTQQPPTILQNSTKLPSINDQNTTEPDQIYTQNFTTQDSKTSQNSTASNDSQNINVLPRALINSDNSTSLNVTTSRNSSTEISHLNSTTPTVSQNITANASSTGYNITTMNVTTCTTISNTTDPLKIKGPPINTTNMKCAVDIITKDYRIRNEVDCNVLMKYSMQPQRSIPKTESAILPSKRKLQSWLDNPPWWLSLFIAI